MFSYVRPRAAVRGAHASPAPHAGRRTKVDNVRPRVSIESSILTYRFQRTDMRCPRGAARNTRYPARVVRPSFHRITHHASTTHGSTRIRIDAGAEPRRFRLHPPSSRAGEHRARQRRCIDRGGLR
ncbi:hypothetical protein [Burkholderia pseudomallei]|uniref:hypothetical protein n=1 Tax=Burkholderia pseudomallei TaxID=28450 RepID=UPI00218057A9|nr:hypothetical protein [Burkholderia pseudomallei]